MADNNYSVINKTAAQINTSLANADTAVAEIGTLSSLTTDAQSNLVAAVNEVDDHADTAGADASTALSNIGTLSNLTTTAKGNTVAAINEVDANADNAGGKAVSLETAMAENAAGDRYGIPTMGGQPMVLFCSVETPEEATVPDNWKQFDPDTEEGYNWDGTPTLIGQRYVYTPDTGDGAEYVAVRADATAYTLRWMKV